MRRETFEESGIRLGRVVYHASQPWPFPYSLMIGCFGEALNDDIRADMDELEDCRWFFRDEVASMLARDPSGRARRAAIRRHRAPSHPRLGDQRLNHGEGPSMIRHTVAFRLKHPRGSAAEDVVPGRRQGSWRRFRGRALRAARQVSAEERLSLRLFDGVRRPGCLSGLQRPPGPRRLCARPVDPGSRGVLEIDYKPLG